MSGQDVTRPHSGGQDAPRERQEGWAVPIDRVEAFTSGATMSVEIGEIENQLRAFWRQAAERAQRGDAGLAVIRACLWNFVVHISGEAEFQRVKPLLDEVSQSVPARIVTLFESAPDEDAWSEDVPIKAYIEANLRRSGARREVIAEEITLEARRMEARRLPSLVRALLLPDLPTALFVSGALSPEGAAAQLQVGAEVDRLILDTGRLPGRAAFFDLTQALLNLLGPGGPGAPASIEVADLGWLRLFGVRHKVAALFDDGATRLLLPTIDHVELHHPEGGCAGALLTLGWLMCRLGWAACKTAAHKEGEFLLRGRGGRPVHVRLTESALPESGVKTGGWVELRAGDQCLSTRDAPAVARRGEGQDSQLLVRALGGSGRDPLLLAAIKAALTLRPQIADHGPRQGGPLP